MIVERASAADVVVRRVCYFLFLQGKKMSGSSELNPAKSKGHRVRFEQSWIELSSSLRKRTAQRRSAITESERSDSEWLYRSSSGSETAAQPEL